ncbi:MAG: hypothetical protein Q4E65_10355, partial [Clostridia bacterium]|nr:hypothetical protein [Clostridia bacterium]
TATAVAIAPAKNQNQDDDPPVIVTVPHNFLLVFQRFAPFLQHNTHEGFFVCETIDSIEKLWYHGTERNIYRRSAVWQILT